MASTRLQCALTVFDLESHAARRTFRDNDTDNIERLCRVVAMENSPSVWGGAGSTKRSVGQLFPAHTIPPSCPRRQLASDAHREQPHRLPHTLQRVLDAVLFALSHGPADVHGACFRAPRNLRSRQPGAPAQSVSEANLKVRSPDVRRRRASEIAGGRSGTAMYHGRTGDISFRRETCRGS